MSSTFLDGLAADSLYGDHLYNGHFLWADVGQPAQNCNEACPFDLQLDRQACSPVYRFHTQFLDSFLQQRTPCITLLLRADGWDSIGFMLVAMW